MSGTAERRTSLVQIAVALIAVTELFWGWMVFYFYRRENQGAAFWCAVLALLQLVVVHGLLRRRLWAQEVGMIVSFAGVATSAFQMSELRGGFWVVFPAHALVFLMVASSRAAFEDSVEEPESQSFGEWLRENIEAVVVAFVMALVIRCFFVEVFKIPSSSMEPTLIGRPVGGDRILVDKLVYRFVPVHRFDVVVFRYPLDVSRNFIKRAVGLPGETLRLYQGDVFHRTTEEGGPLLLARKPPEVQHSIWVPFQVPAWREGQIRGPWRVPPDAVWTSRDDDVRIEGSGLFVLGRHVKDDYGMSAPGHDVADVRWAGKVTLEEGAVAVVRLRYGRVRGELVLAARRTPRAEIWTSAQEEEAEAEGAPAFEVGKTYEVAWMRFDGGFSLRIDGRVVLDRIFCRTLEEVEPMQAEDGEVAFGVRSGAARFEGVGIWRDLHYVAKENIGGNALEIPHGKYVVFGDNSNNSKDSRQWMRRDVIYTGPDGEKTHLWGDADSFSISPEDAGKRTLVDGYGISRTVDREWIVEEGLPEPYPFVDEDLIMGRAFFVWWPAARMKRIR